MVCADQFVRHPLATLVLKARAAAPLQPLASHWDNASFRCVFCLLWRMEWRRRLEAGGTSLGAEGYHVEGHRGAGLSEELHLRRGVSRVKRQGPIVTGDVM